MKHWKKRQWIAFLAAMFLFGNIAAAVNVCAGSATAGASHVAAADVGECCDMQSDHGTGDPADCCTELTMEHRHDKPAGTGGGVTVLITSLLFPVQALIWPRQDPVQVPVLHVAGPPLHILLKNFRS